MLYKVYGDRINRTILKKAIERTSIHRGSLEILLQYKEIARLLKISEIQKSLWRNYIQANPYAKDVDFLDTISVYEEIGSFLT